MFMVTLLPINSKKKKEKEVNPMNPEKAKKVYEPISLKVVIFAKSDILTASNVGDAGEGGYEDEI